MEPTKEAKLAIIEQETTMYVNTRWQLEMRHRVNKKLGWTSEQLKAIEDELVNIEKTIEELENIKAEL